MYPLAEEEHQGFLYLLRERMALDALETDLLLASQLRALSRVYRAVTHDLKAPLHAMVLNLDRLQVALRRGEGAEEAEKTQGYLDVLREELERLDRSLVALLAETTPAGSGREEFDVRATIQEIERLLLPQARLQHVALEAQLPGTAVRIAGQRDRLKQAILNVAINALDAMSEGGALEMSLEALPEEAEVRISDTGPGIPEEMLRRIFDMHYTTKTTGTGIGLYLARSIVEAHGGEISVENRPGPGQRVPAPAAGARAGRLTALLHALVVEDDKNALGALAELVADEGFAVEKATSVRAARARLAAQTPDVVLLDLILPDGTGFDLIQDLQGQTDRVEIVVITGHASVSTAVDALRHGASDYLTKPVDVARLKLMLANLARSRELRPRLSELRRQVRRARPFRNPGGSLARDGEGLRDGEPGGAVERQRARSPARAARARSWSPRPFINSAAAPAVRIWWSTAARSRRR